MLFPSHSEWKLSLRVVPRQHHGVWSVVFAAAGVYYIPQQSPKGEREPLLLGHRAAGPVESAGAAMLSPGPNRAKLLSPAPSSQSQVSLLSSLAKLAPPVSSAHSQVTS